MEKTTFSDEGVSTLLNEKFVPLKIDIDDFDGYALKEHFGVKVLPTFLIFNSDGKVIERIEETLSPSRMTQLLEESLSAFTPAMRPANISPTEQAAPESDFARNQNKAYKIQVGFYSSYENTLKKYHELSAIVEEPIIIMHDYKGGSIVYRMLLGSFASTADAHYYLSDLKKKHDIDGHIYL